MKRNNEAIIEYLKDVDPTYRVEGNVIYAEKVFIVRSIVDWCSKSQEAEKLGMDQIKAYLTLVHKFIKGDINLFWEDDSISYTKIIRSEKDAKKI